MAIAIPAIIDTQLVALRNSLLPNSTPAAASTPYAIANRAADLVRILTDLIDSGTLTATGGTASSFQDTGAFTGVNSLVGATFTFDAATTTVALRGVTAVVASNSVNELFFTEALPTTPGVGDIGTLEFTGIDAKLEAIDGGKGLGNSQSNAHGGGREFVNAALLLMQRLGASPPAFLTAAEANPGGIGNPLIGGGTRGHGGAALVADTLQAIRDAVAAYTAPA